MILVYQVLMIIGQAILLLAIIHSAAGGGRTVFQRYFNPGCWYVLFYILWFFLPQIVSITNNNFIIDFPGATDQVVLRSQVHLLAFNACILFGIMLVRLAFDYRSGELKSHVIYKELRKKDLQLLTIMYVIGSVAMIYLGVRFLNIEGMRSELVKTPVGMVVTILGFFGVFSMAVLTGHGLAERKYLMALLAIGVLGGSIFFTGARGRLLWPVSLAVVYTLCRANELKLGRIISLGVIGLAVLLVFDPVLTAVRGGIKNFDTGEVREKIAITNLFMEKRNFDGFANFTLISTKDAVQPNPAVLLTGGRAAFMGQYYADVFEGGVGFGTTVPGMFWLAGRLYGLLIGGVAYGMMFGLLGFLVRRIRHEPMFWSYMFAMTWLGAVGGNFQESLDKMVAIASPGFIWMFLAPPTRAVTESYEEGTSNADTGSEVVEIMPASKANA